MKTVLSIAGSDCSGGAGIQADLKTITMFGMYGMSAITALTAQNTTGVYGIEAVSPEFLEQQLDCIFTDIRPDAVKIGMLSDAALIRSIVKKLTEYKAGHIVLDTVLVSSSGTRLLEKEAEQVLVKELIPLSELLTPNIPEAEVLSGVKISSGKDWKKDRERAAEKIGSWYAGCLLIKGGHGSRADDLIYQNGRKRWLYGDRIDNLNTHGTGCTLSSAAACGLAAGKPAEESILNAKEYLTGAIKAGLSLGRGSGPLCHNYRLM